MFGTTEEFGPTDRPEAATGRVFSKVSQRRFGGSLGLFGSLGSSTGSAGSYTSFETVLGFLRYLSEVLGDLDLDRVDLA